MKTQHMFFGVKCLVSFSLIK